MSGSVEGGCAGGLEKIYDLAYGGMNWDGLAQREFFTIIARYIHYYFTTYSGNFMVVL